MLRLWHFFLLLSWWSLAANALAAPEIYHVGIYQNPPLAFLDESGLPRGLFPDLLASAAKGRNWQPTYEPCAWAECLDKLDRGEIDLLAPVAYTAERAANFDFLQHSVISNWGQIYVPTQSPITSILDLQDKRVAVLAGDVFLEGDHGLRQLARNFGLKIDFLEVGSYDAALSLTDFGEADAALVNRIFGAMYHARFDLKPSAILINPVDIRLAFAKGRAVALQHELDARLAAWKVDETSNYHRLLGRWLSPQGEKPEFPRWFVPLMFMVTTLLVAMWLTILLSRRRVRQQTRQIEARKHQLEQELAARRRAEEQLCENERRLKHLAHHDSLTGLPNRLLFEDRLRHALAQAQRRDRKMALMFIDLDRFKNINDTLGHEVGDRILVEVGRRLRVAVRESDTVARLGGDEFLILLDEIDHLNTVTVMSKRILEELGQVVEIGTHQLVVTGSVGISLFPDDAMTAEDLLKCADVAMYHAKEEGKDNYQFYTARMNARAHEMLLLERDLRRALEEDQLCLHYQPQVELNSGRLVGVEALVRWNHPHQGLVAPADFVTLAEETGLIVPIGDWVLREACRQQVAWQNQGFPSLRMAVNLSGRQLKQPDFIETVDQILAETGIDPHNLELEITENIIMRDVKSTIMELTDLRVRGIGLSIDDFGTGYSSLSYLNRFPVDQLKIDHSFILRLAEEKEPIVIVDAVIGLGRSMDLEVIAEGIETPRQMEILASRGCHHGQGFLFSHPLPEAELRKKFFHKPKTKVCEGAAELYFKFPEVEA